MSNLMPPGALRAGRGVTAVLGPTNTGKTHLAIERMIGHETGMIGLPLRLLAREVYGRIADRVGAEKVALITGEEKIKPEDARYFVCTVEAMPRDVSVDFLAVDEIQLAGDLDRGHVFTDRLLHWRGKLETLMLGAQTIQPLIERMLPGANVISRPRLSHLSYAGDKKITRLPRRSAIVAFSASEVYAIAELVRRQRGGAAVVLGALSPRTRNAQVALYQAGDVDFLIATDAIGMGLNLEVDHIAFAGDTKFDGFQHRRLVPAEFGQIAGRAGRHINDGTFGVTGRIAPLEDELVERLESHDFAPLQVLQWRNTALDFSDLDALIDSLDRAPETPGLTRAPLREDRQALEIAARDPDVGRALTTPEALERLWSICAVPDYRKIAPANHAELVISIFNHLTEDGVIDEDWIAQQIGYADRVDGDIDTLSNRIAHVRTWTFVANRPDWLKDPEYWRQTTRAVEDRLSDALHECLTQRFVDRRTSVLMRRLQETETLEAHVADTGELTVEKHYVGRIAGLVFQPDATTEAQHGKAIRAAAQRVLATTLRERAGMLSQAPDEALKLETDGRITWSGSGGGAPVGRLERSDDTLVPRAVLIADDALTGAARDRAAERLQAWIEGQSRTLLKPLFDLREAEGIEGIARGIAFQLVENLGILARADVAGDIKALDQDVRAKLRALGVRFGAYHIFVPALLKPAPRTLLAQLYTLANGGAGDGLTEVLALSASGRTSVPVDPAISEALYRSVGYRVCGKMAVRIDILERLADLIRPLVAWRDNGANSKRPEGAEPGNAFRITVDMTSLVGCSGEDFASILRALNYRSESRTVRAEDIATATPVTEETTQAAEPEAKTDQAAAADPVAVGQTEAAEIAPAQEPVPETTTNDPAPAIVVEPTPETDPSRDAADDTSVVTIEIWRPKPAQRGERKPGHRSGKRPARTPARTDGRGSGNGDGSTANAARKGKGPKSGRPQRRNGGGRPPGERGGARKEPAIDPASPFAALAALKDQLEKGDD